MKLVFRITMVFLVLAGFALSAGAATITLTPQSAPPYYDGSNLLFHSYYYTWGINQSLGEPLTFAELRIYNLTDTNGGSNRLYIDLLDSAPSGFVRHFDQNETFNDDLISYASSNSIALTPLVTYSNVPFSPPANYIYTFTAADLAVLNNYGSDGLFAIGIDSDCYFNNTGIELVLAPVPEPANSLIMLLGTGLVGIAGWGRKKFRKK